MLWCKSFLQHYKILPIVSLGCVPVIEADGVAVLDLEQATLSMSRVFSNGAEVARA
jgi:hypothetical protein